jgi:polyisoprenoid-binding protein YceI
VRIVLRTGASACAFMLCAGAAQAAVLQLQPSDARIGLTVDAMGMFPEAGHFSRFTGTLTVDPGHPETCRVAMQVEVASLAMSTQTGTHMALGPTMLDPAQFPKLTYEGDCTATRSSGQLTLHGVTRPITMAATRDDKGIAAHGTLRRQDYAIRGFPGLVGATINVVFAVDVPPDLAKDLPR